MTEHADNDSRSVKVPFPDYIRDAAREAAWTVIREHVDACPIKKVEERVRVLEARFNLLLGAVIASGVLGGSIGAGILRLFGS